MKSRSGHRRSEGSFAKSRRHCRLRKSRIRVHYASHGNRAIGCPADPLDSSVVVRVDFDECAGNGCTPEELVGDDYAPTQSLADQVRAGGVSAMVVPSSALPGTQNLSL